MRELFTRFHSFVKEEEGVTMLEYVLIGGLISIAAASILPDIGAKLLVGYMSIDAAMP